MRFVLWAAAATALLRNTSCQCEVNGTNVSIEACGAVPMKESAARDNGHALACALEAAGPGFTVVVPYGQRWFVIPARSLVLAANVTLAIEGELVAHNRIGYWPLDDTGRRCHLSLIKVVNTTGFTVRGRGAINGQGHAWWWHFVRPGSMLRVHKRPVLLELVGCDDLRVYDVALLDSPRFHLFLTATRAHVRGVSVVVDWRKQRRILLDDAKRRSPLAWAILRFWESWKPFWWNFPLPMFPFNTDGIDVAGSDILVEDVVVSNWDDIVAVKPSKMTPDVAVRPPLPTWHWCTRNVTIRNVTTLYGGGLSVGSVHPSEKFPCVRDVVFQNIDMFRPYKGPYVKPDLAPATCNLATCGAAILDVTFENVSMHGSRTPEWWNAYERSQRSRGGVSLSTVQPEGYWQRLRRAQGTYVISSFAAVFSWLARRPRSSSVCSSRWYIDVLCFAWPLYIGPQQQAEPGGVGSGLWAETEPYCSIANITLRNLYARDGIWPQAAAAVRCHPDNPCTGIVLENVSIDGTFDSGDKWICDGKHTVYGTTKGRVTPHPDKHCLHQGGGGGGGGHNLTHGFGNHRTVVVATTAASSPEPTTTSGFLLPGLLLFVGIIMGLWLLRREARRRPQRLNLEYPLTHYGSSS